MIKLVGIVLITLVFSQTVKNSGRDFSVYIGMTCSLVLLGMGISEMMPIIDLTSEIGAESGFSEYVNAVIKALGIGIITETSSDMCTDLGENQLAGKVDFFGKCEIMLISVPLLREVLSAVREILK